MAMETEKPDPTGQSATQSQPGSTSRDTPARDDGTPYPTGLKLGFIVLALCLSVFLMALEYVEVREGRHSARDTDKAIAVTPSSRLLSPLSPTRSTACPMWVGTAAVSDTIAEGRRPLDSDRG